MTDHAIYLIIFIYAFDEFSVIAVKLCVDDWLSGMRGKGNGGCAWWKGPWIA